LVACSTVRDGRSVKALLKRADLAMIAAKRHCASHAFFSPDDAAVTPARQDAATNGNLTNPADFG